ncbi:hypothetical protein [Anabaena azotica]|uniref:Uncharacterized protein n=1 Tax=Anabaena azotica FACHB-119 TaxID=947527 RepID=A0ABR8D6H3_9NOST|nr:hypothetical protein [Anabaena azotica]MBD2502764.1 hypothetical protein [Anabaena azotica FACHB-119]
MIRCIQSLYIIYVVQIHKKLVYTNILHLALAIRNRGYTNPVPPGTPTPEASYGSPPGASSRTCGCTHRLRRLTQNKGFLTRAGGH